MLVLLHNGHMDDDDHSFFKSEHMVELHVGFELLSWALLLNVGSLFGRYMKNPSSESTFKYVEKLLLL